MEKIPSHIVTSITCDVLVTGAGTAGSIAARLLALAGLKVILLDGDNGATPKIGESLPGAARPILQRLGLLPWIEKSAPIINNGNLSCWGTQQLRATDFIRDPFGCGWHLDRQRFDLHLRKAAEEAGSLFINERLSSLSTVPDGIQAQAGELKIEARWIIDASGKSRSVAGKFGHSKWRDPPLFALYTWCENSHTDTRSMIEAVPTGWWYTAGLPDQQKVLAFFTLPDQAKAILRNKDNFLSLLNSTVHVSRRCNPDDLFLGPLQITEAAGSYLDKAFGPHWIAVGDAALSFDPLSSQGIYNALYTGMRGAEAVKSMLISNDDALILSYGERIESIRTAYCREVSRYYQQEQRWPDQPFWLTHQSERR